MEFAGTPGLGIYLTSGWPNSRGFLELSLELSECADFIEIGLPSENPLYDGPIIRGTHVEVLKAGISRAETLKLAGDVIRETGVPAVMLAYLSDFRDVAEPVKMASAMGAVSALLPDLPFERFRQLDLYVEVSRRFGLKPSFLASPRFPHGVLRLYSRLNPLLVYVALQPATGIKLARGVESNVRLARSLLGPRVYMVSGFAIRAPETARRLVNAGANAVVIGSEIVRRAREGGVSEAKRFVCEVKLGLGGG